MKKPNLQSPLDRLTDAQQHAVWEMLRTTKLEDAVALVRQDYDVRTTKSSLARFFKRRTIVEELRDANAAADAFADEAGTKRLREKEREAVTLAFWEAYTRKDAESIAAFGKLAVNMDSLAAAREQLDLAREKFEAAEKRLETARGTVQNAKLTDAEKMRRMKELFG